MIISMNGTLIEQAEAVVSIYDHGFLYGIGLFETFRTYGGRPFLLERHLQRLAEGCEQLGIRPAPTAAGVREQVARLLAANGLEDAYFRLTVTAGTDALGLPAGEYERPNTILYVKPLPAADEAVYRAGKPLRLLGTRRNTPEGPYRLKSLHYMNNLLAKRELQSVSAAASSPAGVLPEGLMLTADGYVAEGIVSNVFFVRGNGGFGRSGPDGSDACLCTPALSTGILPGITRAFVLELARDRAGVRVEEGLYTWQDLLAADEVFITNSIQELVPVTTLIDEWGKSCAVGGTGRPGPLTERLLKLYRKEANSL
jgi:4-amino-4-deoxychorismate lyase